MTKGIVMLAQNTDETDYVKQAYLNALSIIHTNPDTKVSLITNDSVDKTYKNIFDKIIDIPWNDSAVNDNWKVSNRWKIYHASPYDETIVMDTDMIVLQDISSWWKILNNYELYFVKNVKTYRGDYIQNSYYRKAFQLNDLPNTYVGFHYFKKCDTAMNFYKMLEIVCNNYEAFYFKFISKHTPKFLSIDVAASLVIKILNIEDQVTNDRISIPTFTHMKNNVQGWKSIADTWQDRIDYFINDELELIVGNYIQTGVFHYTEKDFCNDKLISLYESKREN